MFRFPKNLWHVFAFLLALASPATGQSEQTAPALIRAGDYQAARELLISQDASMLERAYYDGIILQAQGKHDEAIAQFRRILQQRPEQVLVRQALFQSLLVTDSYEAAEFHLEQLIEQDDNPRSQTQYRRLQQQILAEKPYGISGSISVVPSSNVNRGTSNDVFSTGVGDFTIQEDSQEQAGTSLKGSASAFRRFAIDETSIAVIDGALAFSQNLDGGDPILELRVGGDYRQATADGYWEISPKLSFNWTEGEFAYRTTGLDYTYLHRSSRQNIWTYRVGGYYGAFEREPFRDGYYLNGSASLRRLVNPSLSVTGTFGYSTGLPEREDLQYDDYSVALKIDRSWSNGWQASLGTEFDYRLYRANFNAVDFPREDTGAMLSASFANSNISFNGLRPSLGCSVKDVTSTVAFYEYTVTECGLGLSRRF